MVMAAWSTKRFQNLPSEASEKLAPSSALVQQRKSRHSVRELTVRTINLLAVVSAHAIVIKPVRCWFVADGLREKVPLVSFEVLF